MARANVIPITTRKRQRVPISDVCTPEQLAAIDFEPIPVRLDEMMSNEEFGELMISVRIAALNLSKTKPELVEIVRRMDEGRGLDDKSHAIAVHRDLEFVADKFKHLSEACSAASMRFLAAMQVYADEAENGK